MNNTSLVDVDQFQTTTSSKFVFIRRIIIGWNKEIDFEHLLPKGSKLPSINKDCHHWCIVCKISSSDFKYQPTMFLPDFSTSHLPQTVFSSSWISSFLLDSLALFRATKSSKKRNEHSVTMALPFSLVHFVCQVCQSQCLKNWYTKYVPMVPQCLKIGALNMCRWCHNA